MKAVIFDMDGVIVDTNPYHRAAWRAYYERYGKTLSDADFVRYVSGKHNADIVAHLFAGQPLTPDEVLRLGNEKEALFRDLYRPHITPVPGLVDFLKALRATGIRTAVATSAPVENLDFVVDALAFRPYFAALLNLMTASGSAWAQGKYVVGTVVDQTTNRGVDRATIVNQRTRQRARTNATGRFFLTAQPGDSLVLNSQLYTRTGIRYDGSDSPQIVAKALPPMPYRVVDLAEVTVTAKRYEEVKREIQQVLDEPTASTKVTGEQAFDRLADGAGVTLLYEMFGKRPKSDRKAYVIMQQDRRHALALERFRLLVDQATDLKGEAVDRFFDFCDLDDEFLLRASDYDLINTVQQLRTRYRHGFNRPSRIAPDPDAAKQ